MNRAVSAATDRIALALEGIAQDMSILRMSTLSELVPLGHDDFGNCLERIRERLVAINVGDIMNAIAAEPESGTMRVAAKVKETG